MRNLMKEWTYIILPFGVAVGVVVIPGLAYLMGSGDILTDSRNPLWEQMLWGGVYGVAISLFMGLVMWLGSQSEPRVQVRRSEYVRLLELIENFTDPDPCHYDHHGYCQTHNLQDRPCPQRDCRGVMKIAQSKNCSCHTNPPCSSCVDAGLVCGLCGWESAPSTYEPEPKTFRRVKRELGSRRNEITRTHTDGPFNSTPFTDCCHVAAVYEDRCPVCKASIVGHDDGLDARRREVGPGNCLMCGSKRGDPAISGNCNC